MTHHPVPLPIARTPWPWPLPALRAWVAGWAAWALAGAVAAPPVLAFAAGGLACAGLAWGCAGLRRRLIAVAGFPLSALALGVGNSLPPWAWLLALLPLLAAYPVHAWRDAPFFPSPADALDGLQRFVDPPPRRALDVGCGLGHGLAALNRLWPQCELHGIEWSWPLSAAGALRCRFARVRRGDMWRTSWRDHDLVYVFQRPESMARIFDKACREMAPGSWLVSLEFPVPGQAPRACLQAPGRRPLWVYRVGPAK